MCAFSTSPKAMWWPQLMQIAMNAQRHGNSMQLEWAACVTREQDCVICHFESGGLGAFFVTALVACPEVFFVIGSGCKSTTITVTLRRHTWRQLHCGHLLSLAVIHNSNFHLGNVNLELMKSLNNRGRSGHQLDFRDDVNEVWCLGRQHEFLDIGTLPLMKRMRKCQLQLIQGDWKHH